MTSPVDAILLKIQQFQDRPTPGFIDELQAFARTSARTLSLSDLHRLVNATRQLSLVKKVTKKQHDQINDIVKIIEMIATFPRGADRANWIATHPYAKRA